MKRAVEMRGKTDPGLVEDGGLESATLFLELSNAPRARLNGCLGLALVLREFLSQKQLLLFGLDPDAALGLRFQRKFERPLNESNVPRAVARSEL